MKVEDLNFIYKENTLATKNDIFLLKSDVLILRKEIAAAKVDIIKWLVATGIGITGLVVALVKLL